MILLLRVTLLFAAGWFAALVLVRKSAAARHFVWALTLTGAVALAIAAPLVPAVAVRVSGWPAPPVTAPFTSRVFEATPPSTRTDLPKGPISETVSVQADERSSIPSLPAGVSAGFLLGAVWLLGAVLVAAWYGLGHLRLYRLARRAAPIQNPEWHDSLREVAARSGVTAPVQLFRTTAVGSPLTWGTRRPVVLLPDDAESWPIERQRVVLAHELAHAVRADYLSQLIACTTCALYWFHPLAWAAARRLRVESERACDDHVLVRGVSGVDYAAHLLDVARQSHTIRLGGAVAIGMARPSHLEGRLLAVLDPACPRQVPPRRAQRAGWAGLAALVVPLALLTPVARTSIVPVQSGGSTPIGLGEDSTFDQSLPAKPGEQLELDLESGGSVDVQGWDRPLVQVRGRLGGANWADTRVTLERTDGGVRLHSWQGVRRNSSATHHRFEIMVPRRFDVHVSSAGGTLTLTDIEGVFEGETGGGGYLIAHAKGEARLGTGGGDIRVTDSDLRGRVNTGGGTILLSRVSGGLRGSSGSGPVIESDENGGSGDGTGMLHIQKAGGDITLDAAPKGAEVFTGGGNVRVGRSSGMVDASTGGGDVTVGPVAGSVKAGTGAGEVHVWITEAQIEQKKMIDVVSGSGSVVLELPPNLSARFELETSYTRDHDKGRIDSDWDLRQEETDRWDDREGSPRKYVRATGSVGAGGALISVKTVNGNITVRRRSP